MAISKAMQTLFPTATPVAAGTIKGAPVVSSAITCTSYYGGELTYKISNSTGTYTSACVLTFQVSHDGTSWYDYYTVAGDIIASSVFTGSILLDRGVMFVRAIAYGVAGTGVSSSVESFLQAVTGL